MSDDEYLPNKDDYVEVNSIQFTFDDIRRVVDAFYKKVATDKHLKVPFNSVEDWPHHIERLTHFWWTRFGGRAYLEARYNPVQKHFETGFNEFFLDHWLDLFKGVLFEELESTKAQFWFLIAQNMGEALNRNNELMKQHHERQSRK